MPSRSHADGNQAWKESRQDLQDEQDKARNEGSSPKVEPSFWPNPILSILFILSKSSVFMFGGLERIFKTRS
jgi:hypothetical protein